MKIVSLAVIVLAAATYAPAEAQQCLKYDSQLSLTGKLYSKVFPGPPNYESIRKGDRKEIAWLLTLSKPICTLPGDPPDDAEANVPEIQLVISQDADWKTVKSLAGQRVTVTGTLFHASTGHHRRNVLISVSKIRR
jgi:hypothetical protein